jgi:hypothetical protein
MTIVEMNAAVQGIGVLFNFVKAHKELAEYNDLSAAVSEVNAELITSQAATIASQKESLTLQQERLTLTQRIGELEEKIRKLESWDGERERYDLVQIPHGPLAYGPKAGLESGKPAHHLCANCFDRNEKAILQTEHIMGGARRYHCQRCGGAHVMM